jgi:hypothetical protein
MCALFKIQNNVINNVGIYCPPTINAEDEEDRTLEFALGMGVALITVVALSALAYRACNQKTNSLTQRAEIPTQTTLSGPPNNVAQPPRAPNSDNAQSNTTTQLSDTSNFGNIQPNIANQIIPINRITNFDQAVQTAFNLVMEKIWNAPGYFQGKAIEFKNFWFGS